MLIEKGITLKLKEEKIKEKSGLAPTQCISLDGDFLLKLQNQFLIFGTIYKFFR
jgi:hypothetical protein